MRKLPGTYILSSFKIILYKVTFNAMVTFTITGLQFFPSDFLLFQIIVGERVLYCITESERGRTVYGLSFHGIWFMHQTSTLYICVRTALEIPFFEVAKTTHGNERHDGRFTAQCSRKKMAKVFS